ncbi:MAG: hypothetical protein WC080_04625 [Patescibacteria group bacterium]
MKKEIESKTGIRKTSVCFVCSDNIARSLMAEYCLKEYSKKNNITNLNITSAGTDTSTDTSGYNFAHFDELKKIGIDVSGHKRTQLTQKIIDDSDLIVAMAEYHQDWICEHFGIKVPMFSEIVSGKKISFHIPPPDSKECDSVLRNMVHEIYGSMPVFVKNMKKFIKK